MLSRFRHVYAVLLFLIVASCSGGGCSGCTGCGGSTPLPGGFPKEKAIENAAAVRVSRPGLDFLEKNLPDVAAKAAGATGGTLTEPIPETAIGKSTILDLGIFGSEDFSGTICPGGPNPASNPPKCTAAVNLGASSFTLDSVKPDNVQLNATLPLQLDDTPITAQLSGLLDIAITLHVGYGANGKCVGANQDQASVDPKNLPVKISIPLVAETEPPRTGYTKVDVDNANVDISGISSNDLQFCANCGPLTFSVPGFGTVNLCNSIFNISFIKDTIVGQLTGQLNSQVKGLLKGQLCTAPNAALNPPCPDGTGPDANNKYCVFKTGPKSGQCVPTLLGTDAHVDLSGALASLSPGTGGGLDFGLASAGAMQPLPNADANPQGRTPNGITLGMIGGVLPKPESKCVPAGGLPVIPTGIPIPDELAPTAADPATAPHLGVALAGRFIDYSMVSVYKSGLLCLGITSEQVSQIRAGLLSIIIPSLKNLTFEQGDAAAAITTRPQMPPTVKLGSGADSSANALLTVTLPKFAIDFYVWSYDRFIRAMTFEGDFTLPVNLQTGKDPVKNPNGGIIPVVGDIKVANGTVTNSDLLSDDPAVIAGAIQGLLGAFSKQLGGGINPIDLSSALKSFGLGMEINQISKLTKENDDFIGIFATLNKGAAANGESDTTAKLVSKTVPVDRMQLTTMSRDALPELVVDAGSSLDDGQHAIEYSWWIDQGTHAAWRADKHIVIKDDQLLLQGRHVLHVSSRIAGMTVTEDATPADVPFVIDALAPFVTVDHEGTTVKLTAWDLVSDGDALLARYRLDDADFGAWQHLSEIAKIDVAHASDIEVQVKDEEGNVRTVQQPLIRGRSDGSLTGAGSGCGCSTPGDRDPGGLVALLAGVAGIAAIALRRTRGSRGAHGSHRSHDARGASIRHAAMALGAIGVVAATSQGCACGSTADDGPACGADCNSPCGPPLDLGLPGSYTSVAKSKDGTIWVAGYNNALIEEGQSTLFGDLVAGKYDLGKQQVQWTTVDGLPQRTQGCPDHPSDTWRNGETDAGDDVGLWTSTQVSSEDHPMVSYYDATNHRLKLAYEDGGWHTFVVREAPPGGGDVGRYSKMLVVGDKPVVAFLQIEQGDGGHVRSRVVVARSHDATPHGPESFDFEDAAVEESNPCSPALCTLGQACLKDQGICSPTVGGCTPADCGGADKACVTIDSKATCASVAVDAGTYPNVFGDYVSLAQGPGGLGIAVYDRVHGNLVGLADRGGGKWDRFIIDGEVGSRADKTAVDTGDVGVGASLAIDGVNVWHLSYVNGLDESLRYITYSDKPGKAEIVDDGSGVGGSAFTDGLHVVGDDSTIHVDGDIVTIYYQDATAGTLRRAGGTPSGSTHQWDLRVLQQPGKFAGFSPAILPGEDKVANFWQSTDRNEKSMTGDVAIITP